MVHASLAASLLDGVVEADPWVAAVLIGAIVVAAVTFVILRVRRREG